MFLSGLPYNAQLFSGTFLSSDVYQTKDPRSLRSVAPSQNLARVRFLDSSAVLLSFSNFTSLLSNRVLTSIETKILKITIFESNNLV